MIFLFGFAVVLSLVALGAGLVLEDAMKPRAPERPRRLY